MKNIVKIIYFLVSLLIIIYTSLPNIKFPDTPDNFVRSHEPADIEDENRRGYFTNLNRDSVIKYFSDNYSIKISNYIKIKSIFILNYPPEDSQTIIRDQTRSTYLQELVFPLRESFFINGFEPKEDKDVIIVNNKNYTQKTILKMNESVWPLRLIVCFFALTLGYFILGSFFLILRKNYSELSNIIFKYGSKK